MNSQSFLCTAYLDESKGFCEAYILRENNKWDEFTIESTPIPDQKSSYLVQSLPIDIHLHGLGGSDFSKEGFFDLSLVNQMAKNQGIICVPSIFLSRQHLDDFVEFINKFSLEKKNGEYTHIAGLSLEGPLLSSHGGTPTVGNWMATKSEWEKISNCGEKGLKYIVLSPDIFTEGSFLSNKINNQTPSLEWIVSLLFEAEIGISMGHFHKSTPEESAQCIQQIIDIASKHFAKEKIRDFIMVDHFFNDMPSNITYAWRTPERQVYRTGELEALNMDSWNLENLSEKVGPVPAKLLNAAKDGLVTICINFDGEHVDLEVCKKIIELIGSENITAMTDHLDNNRMGNLILNKRKESSLWFKDDGIVAAGSSTMEIQMTNLRRIGIPEKDIWKICSFSPARLLRFSDNEKENLNHFSFVDINRIRHSGYLDNLFLKNDMEKKHYV
ncbi:N-acetylglucosamine-6-phosphate deacetylase [Lysinibacillus sp. RSDA_15]|uniref:N-acetylglucosamine-6-phosphate deacetylase n=1 Tax=Lysinibacillus TaxID=400634 RepID=UPI0018CD41BA|nr:N-acetylglucosamine-6-phosphate deacetylase [Lysinibacillus sphaericus]QTB11599.1 N-acetylglucosamine-6-phosphate deacetylase [Lysinibacillus sphaericus]